MPKSKAKSTNKKTSTKTAKKAVTKKKKPTKVAKKKVKITKSKTKKAKTTKKPVKKIIKKTASKPKKKKKLSKKAEEKASKLKKLTSKGKEKGFVTYDEILKEFPEIETDVPALTQLYTDLEIAGVDILEGGGLLEIEPEKEKSRFAYTKSPSQYD